VCEIATARTWHGTVGPMQWYTNRVRREWMVCVASSVHELVMGAMLQSQTLVVQLEGAGGEVRVGP
jgi:hypothetical protein